MPSQATLGQIVNDPSDLATGYDVSFACIGDAKSVLRQLLAALGAAQSSDPDPTPRSPPRSPSRTRGSSTSGGRG